MPLFYQQDIDVNTRLAVWLIEETEDFFLDQVPVQREITHPQKRLQHLAGRYLLRYLYPDFPHRQIAIASTRKPYLPNDQYHFSISHCANYAAAIVSTKNRVGVDVEIVTPRLENIKKKFLYRDEIRFVNAQPAHQQLNILTLLWSAKEAMYKWYGLGEVDFSEMMRTLPFKFGDTGMIQGYFLKNELQQKLELPFKMWDNLSLVWVMSNQ